MKKLLRILLSFIPTPLPVGMEEFKEWQSSILSLSKVPDNESTRFAVSVMIMHLGPAEDYKAKRYFIKALNKSAANEIANAVCLDLKAKQKARIEAEEEAKKATLAAASSNGSVQDPQV